MRGLRGGKNRGRLKFRRDRGRERTTMSGGKGEGQGKGEVTGAPTRRRKSGLRFGNRVAERE